MANSAAQLWKRPQDTLEARARREAKVEALLYGGDDDVLGNAYDGRLLLRLFRYVGPYRRRLILAVIWMAVSTLLSVSGPWVAVRHRGLSPIRKVGQDGRRSRIWCHHIEFRFARPHVIAEGRVAYRDPR